MTNLDSILKSRDTTLPTKGCIVKALVFLGFPGGSDGKEFTCNARDMGSNLESRRFSEEGNGHPLKYSCLKNSMCREAWRAIVYGVRKTRT